MLRKFLDDFRGSILSPVLSALDRALSELERARVAAEGAQTHSLEAEKAASVATNSCYAASEAMKTYASSLAESVRRIESDKVFIADAVSMAVRSDILAALNEAWEGLRNDVGRVDAKVAKLYEAQVEPAIRRQAQLEAHRASRDAWLEKSELKSSKVILMEAERLRALGLAAKRVENDKDADVLLAKEEALRWVLHGDK